MKENKYNEAVFFEKYSQMNRSKQGLSGAGEWKTLEPLLPCFEGKSVLDLGCGYGWHCIYAAEHGARHVLGNDLSDKMLAVAKEKTQFNNVEYRCAAIEDVQFPQDSFDIVLSSLALHYVPSFEQVAKQVYQILKPGGTFLFSCEHPIFTAQGSQDWIYRPDGSIDHFPVDNYFYQGKRTAVFLGEQVTKYHRTLTSYLMGLLNNGFQITAVVEPEPPEEMMDLPGMKDELRRPMMLIVRAVKPF